MIDAHEGHSLDMSADGQHVVVTGRPAIANLDFGEHEKIASILHVAVGGSLVAEQFGTCLLEIDPG